MRTLLLLIGLCLAADISSAIAQVTIKGKVKDQNGNPIESVNISIKDSEGSTLTFTRTDGSGSYNFTIDQSNVTGLSLEASSIGYKKASVKINDTNRSYDLILEASGIMLETVVVKNRPSLSVNGDTLNYRTSDFADKQDRSISDVLKKMPGMEVAENGKISYNGQAISNLYIDGDNLLDDKYNIGSKSIPHGSVSDVQVIQNDQPLKMMRENNMSEDVALNLVIKDEAKLKIMGEATAGAGTPERFDGNVSAMLFNKDLKFINNLKGNNIGIDPGVDLTAHNMADYLKRLDNTKPDNLLSAGAAGVPSLPQNRSLFNKAGLLNLNNLYKFNQDLQLKANISYLYDKRQQQYSKFSETYLPDQTITYSELQNNSINPQKLHAQFNLTDNAERHYLNNTLILDYKPYGTNSVIQINNSPASQALQQELLDLSNEFNYRKKLKSGDIINLYSYLNRTSRPEILTITPGLNADVLNNGMPFSGINQYIEQPSWYTNTYISFAIVNNKLMQTYKGGFSLQQQELDSELFRVQDDQTVELVSPEAVNSLDWLKAKFYSEAIYEYTYEKIKATLNLPLSYNMIGYTDPQYDLDKSLDKLFLNPSLNIKYQMGSENYLTASYTFKNELGGIDEIYMGSILKNYRSLFANDAPVSETQMHTIGAGFSFRKAMQMLFINLGASYSDAALNTVSAYTLTNNIQQRIVLPLPNHVRSLRLNANVSKYLFDFKSTVNAGVNFTRDKYDQLQNERLLPFDTKAITYRAGIEARLASFVNWSYLASYTLSDNKAMIDNAETAKFEQLRQQSALSFTTFKNVYVNLSAEHLFTHQSSQQDLKYLFADINIKYKLLKMKTDLEFGITNLANIKTFEAISLSANTLTSGIYSIPGRVAMLKATFNF